MFLYSVQTEGQLHPHLSREWLLTNGLGGFAGSTIIGCNTRRYHGLLVAATLPPVGRIVALNRVAEILFLDGREDHPIELSVNQFNTNFHPLGYQYLRTFELGDTARWEFLVEDIRITKEVRLLHNRNAVGIRYHIESDRPRQIEFHLQPFLSLRDFHSLLRAGSATFGLDTRNDQTYVSKGDHGVYMRATGARFFPRPDWWYGHTYAVEQERGQDDSEDLFVPGSFVLKMDTKATLTFWADVEEGLEPAWDESIPRGTSVLHLNDRPHAMVKQEEAATDLSPTMQRLHYAAADFVVRRRRADGAVGATIIAGYPWFADWGRDTMISLPGLLLTTGRFEEAADVLTVFANYVSEGMIPNNFDDYTNKPTYNTVDASLWFIHACYLYRDASGDNNTFDSTLLPACHAILGGYRYGTRFNIHMDERDGLISAGDATTQLTWMDAKYRGVAFTPRQGKAVEINALWYNALRLMGENDLADFVQRNFRRAFWINAFRGLNDVVNGDKKDPALRPNQIFAVSLPFSPIGLEEQRAVVEVVRRELLTPVGLRTLDRANPGYRPRYTGPQSDRDAAYHNGTVWPWPLGHFLDAYLRVNNNTPEAVQQCRLWLTPLIESMEEGCVGQIAEIYDADPPHRPLGCYAQAWSVAEVLRLAAKLRM